MSTIVCNPMNLPYKYNFKKANMPGFGNGQMTVYREAADPTLVLFKGKYYLFPSMTRGFFASNDMADWEYHPLMDPVPVFDYAPDVRMIGEYLYFCASKRSEICNFYRTKDPVHEPFEEIKGSMAFWDPDLFCDDDGRVYLYWGCSNITPIWGVELDRETMKPIGERQVMFTMDNKTRGYERIGMDHVSLKTKECIEAATEEIFRNFMQMPEDQRRKEGLGTEESVRRLARGFAGDDPFIEGAYVTKHGGKYYLQYAFPATQTNVYGDAVLVSEKPLGPYTFAENNPFSYKPGGFINGAGHGSTIADKDGRYWHTSTMSISCNDDMERRIGLWKAGFDTDGKLFCDQRYGDWPMLMESAPFENPPYMLLSYGKNVTVSSGEGAEYVTDECVRDWWRAQGSEREWCCVDLGRVMDVRAIQVNLADEGIQAEIPENVDRLTGAETRYIDLEKRVSRWKLEGSVNGTDWIIIEDKSASETDLGHDLIVCKSGIQIRFIRLTVMELPFHQRICVSGLRIFGNGMREAPAETMGVRICREGDLNMVVRWDHDGAEGHNILWGYTPEKLYHSYMVFGQDEKNIGALTKGKPVFVRVDSFNENGITEGTVIQL